LKDRIQNDGSGHRSDVVESVSAVGPESEEVAQLKPLSASTPTPIFTRVCIHEILLTEMKAAHTIAKNCPVVSFQCGQYSAKTDVAESAGRLAKWVNQSFAFTMRKMTYCKISVSSKGLFVGSTIVSTREILECPKTPNGITILKRQLENDAEFVGYAHIYLRYGAQGEEIRVEKVGDKYASPIKDNVGSLNATQVSIMSTNLHSLNFPVNITVNKLHVLDMMCVHSLTPNSPYAVLTCADWKLKTSVAYVAGSVAEWSDINQSFVLYDDRAVFKVELRSGSVVAGKWSLSIANIVATPRNKEGRIDIAGYIKQGGSLVARVMLQVTILPYITAETKTRMAAVLNGGQGSIADGDAPSANEVLGVLSIKVITVVDLSRLIGGICAFVGVGVWQQTSKLVETVGGMAVVGPLGHLWQNIEIRQGSHLIVRIEAEQGRTLVGELVVRALEILEIPPDANGNIMVTSIVVIIRTCPYFCCYVQIVGDIISGNANRGRVSLGCEFHVADNAKRLHSDAFCERHGQHKPVGGSLQADVETREIHQLSPPAARAPSPSSSISYYKERLADQLSALSSSGLTSSRQRLQSTSKRSSSPTSQVLRSINRDHGRDVDGDIDDFRSITSGFTGIIAPAIERPCTVRIHCISLYDLPSLHVLLPNSPVIFLTYGGWKAKTSEAHRAGNDAEWSNLSLNFTVPVDTEDKLPMLNVLVRSGSLIAGALSINIDDLLTRPRQRNGHLVLTEVLRAQELNRGRIKLEVSFEQNARDVDYESYSLLDKASVPQLLPPILAAKIAVRMITVMDLDSRISGALLATTNSGAWKASTLPFPVISHMTAMTDLTWDQLPLYEHTPLVVNIVQDSSDRTVGIIELSTQDILQAPRDQRENFIVSGLILSPKWEQQKDAALKVNHAVGKATFECRLEWCKLQEASFVASFTEMNEVESVAQPSFRTPSLAPSVGHSSLAAFELASHLPMKIKIHSIRVLDVAASSSSHLVDRSLMVYLTCGSWRVKTTSAKASYESSGAGNASWEELHMSTRIQEADSNLAVVVRSGNSIAGSVIFSPKELVLTPKRGSGGVVLTAYIRNNGIIMGRIQLELSTEKMSTVEESDGNIFNLGEPATVVDSTNLSPRRRDLVVRSAVHSAATDESVFPTPVSSLVQSTFVKLKELLPLKCRILGIQLFDVAAMHILQKNSLSVFVSCDDWKATTEVAVSAGANAEWTDVGMEFIVHSVSSLLHMLVRSKNMIAGAVSLTLNDLCATPIQASGVSSLEVYIRSEGSVVGRLRLNIVLGTDRLQSLSAHSLPANQPYPSSTIVAGVSLQEEGVEPYKSMSSTENSVDQQLEGFSPLKTPQSGRFNASTSITSKSFADLAAIFPLRPSIFSIQLFDLPHLHSLSANSPVVFISCGEWKARTSIADSAGANAEWYGLDLSFLIPDANTPVHMIVRSGSVIIGSWTVHVKDLVYAPRLTSGKCLMNGYIRSDGSIRGRIQLEIDVGIENSELLDINQRSGNTSVIETTVAAVDDSEGELPILLRHLPSLSDSVATSPSERYQQSAAGSSTSRGTSDQSSRSGSARSHHSPYSDSVGSLKEQSSLFLVDIVATDIKNNTNTKKVLPTIKLEISPPEFKTQMRATAINGNSATWTDMMQSFICKNKSTFRVSLFAGTALIGSDTFRGKLLLESVLDNDGTLHITREMQKQNQVTALVSFSFKLEDGDHSVDTGHDSWAAESSSAGNGAGGTQLLQHGGSHTEQWKPTDEETHLERTTIINPSEYVAAMHKEHKLPEDGKGDEDDNRNVRVAHRQKRLSSHEEYRPKSSHGHGTEQEEDADTVKRNPTKKQRNQNDFDNVDIRLRSPQFEIGLRVDNAFPVKAPLPDNNVEGLKVYQESGTLSSADFDSNGYLNSSTGDSIETTSSANSYPLRAGSSVASPKELTLVSPSSSGSVGKLGNESNSVVSSMQQPFKMGLRQVSDSSMLTVESGLSLVDKIRINELGDDDSYIRDDDENTLSSEQSASAAGCSRSYDSHSNSLNYSGNEASRRSSATYSSQESDVRGIGEVVGGSHASANSDGYIDEGTILSNLSHGYTASTVAGAESGGSHNSSTNEFYVSSRSSTSEKSTGTSGTLPLRSRSISSYSSTYSDLNSGTSSTAERSSNDPSNSTYVGQSDLPLKRNSIGEYVPVDPSADRTDVITKSRQAVLRLLSQQSPDVFINSAAEGSRSIRLVKASEVLSYEKRNEVGEDGYFDIGISADYDFTGDSRPPSSSNSACSDVSESCSTMVTEERDEDSSFASGVSPADVPAKGSSYSSAGTSYTSYGSNIGTSKNNPDSPFSQSELPSARSADFSTTGYLSVSSRDTAASVTYSTTGYLQRRENNECNKPESLFSTPTLSPSNTFSIRQSSLRDKELFSEASDLSSSDDGSSTYRSHVSDWSGGDDSRISLSDGSSTSRSEYHSDSGNDEAHSCPSNRTSSTGASTARTCRSFREVSGQPNWMQTRENDEILHSVPTRRDINSEITATSLSRLRSTLSVSHVLVHSAAANIGYNSSESIIEVSRTVAEKNVSRWLVDVIESLVAMEIGLNYSVDCDDSAENNYGNLDVLIGIDPAYYVPRMTVAKVLTIAVTRAISDTVEAYDDNDNDDGNCQAMGNTSVADFIRPSGCHDDLTTSTTSLSREITEIAGGPAIKLTDSLIVENKESAQPQRWRKRQGVTLQAVTNLVGVPEKEPELELDEGEVSDDYFFKVDGYPPVPIKAKITMLDILGFDVSCIDRSIFPRRPYLTACKPYGNWAGRTKEVFVSDKEQRLMTKDDMVFNWYNLSETEGWDSFAMRVGQVLVFDLHDAAAGLIIAKGKVPYEAVLSKKRDGDDRIAFAVDMKIANEYGGGSFTALVRVFIDLSIMKYVRPPKPPEYWEKHRIHHWKTYPLSPICTGIVRRTYGTIALEYDRQKIVHPSLFGFQIHWKGHQTDESRFIHPVFKGYGLSKKPMTTEQAEENVRSLTYATDPNPFRWDPEAAAQGKCPVCSDGVPGCPRCFMLPLSATGQVGTPAAFAFDYDEMMAEQREKMQRAIKERAAKSRKMQVNELYGNVGYDKPAQECEKKKVVIHTNLTTYKSLSMYREYIMSLMAVYVKIMPAGGIRKLFVDPTDSVFNLYNMVVSHIGVGNTRTRMLVLPTNVGLFEITNTTAGADEFSMADTSGQDKLEVYGLRKKRGIVVLLYFARYYPFAVNTFVHSFVSKNSTLNVKDDLPVYDNALSRVPEDLLHDPLQSTLRAIILRQFAQQQFDSKAKYKQMGQDYKTSKERAIAQAIEASRGKSDELEKDRRAAERRIKSQVRHIPLERRGDAIKTLLEREFGKKGHVTDDEKALLLKTEEHYKAKLERRNRVLKDNTDIGESLGDDDSSVLSLSNIKLGQHGADDNGDDEFYSQRDDNHSYKGGNINQISVEEDAESLFDSDFDSDFDDDDEDDEDESDVESESELEDEEGNTDDSENEVEIGEAGSPSRSDGEYGTAFRATTGTGSEGSSLGSRSKGSRSRSRLSSALSHSSTYASSDISDSEYSQSSLSSARSDASSTYSEFDSQSKSSLNQSGVHSLATFGSRPSTGSSTNSSYSTTSSCSTTTRSSENTASEFIDEPSLGVGGYIAKAQLSRSDKFGGKDVIIPYVPGDSGSLMWRSESGTMVSAPSSSVVAGEGDLDFLGYDRSVDYGELTPVSFVTPVSRRNRADSFKNDSRISSASSTRSSASFYSVTSSMDSSSHSASSSRPASGLVAESLSEILHRSDGNEGPAKSSFSAASSARSSAVFSADLNENEQPKTLISSSFAARVSGGEARFDSTNIYGYSGFLSEQLPPIVATIAPVSGYIAHGAADLTDGKGNTSRPSTGQSMISSRSASSFASSRSRSESRCSQESSYYSRSSTASSMYSGSYASTPRSNSSPVEDDENDIHGFNNNMGEGSAVTNQSSSYFGFSGFLSDVSVPSTPRQGDRGSGNGRADHIVIAQFAVDDDPSGIPNKVSRTSSYRSCEDNLTNKVPSRASSAKSDHSDKSARSERHRSRGTSRSSVRIDTAGGMATLPSIYAKGPSEYAKVPGAEGTALAIISGGLSGRLAHFVSGNSSSTKDRRSEGGDRETS
jgi:hypothetical protein